MEYLKLFNMNQPTNAYIYHWCSYSGRGLCFMLFWWISLTQDLHTWCSISSSSSYWMLCIISGRQSFLGGEPATYAYIHTHINLSTRYIYILPFHTLWIKFLRACFGICLHFSYPTWKQMKQDVTRTIWDYLLDMFMLIDTIVRTHPFSPLKYKYYILNVYSLYIEIFL